MSKTPMMKCGHAANAKTKTDNGWVPSCCICGCIEVDNDAPDMAGRMARCVYCNAEEPSSSGLPFFKHLPDKEFDEFYCGCRGWD